MASGRRFDGTALLTLLGMAALLSATAVLNGFPLVFSDTGIYINAALQRFIPWDRAVGYSLFILPLHGTVSLWPVVAAQALLVAAMIQLTARAVFGLRDPRLLLGVTALLVVATGLPWYVGQVMPDFAAGTLILAFLLVLFGWPALGAAERIFVLLVLAVSIGVHGGHALIALGAFPAILLLLLLGWRMGPRPGRRLAILGAAVALGIAAIILPNVAAGRGFTLALGGRVLLLAKLLDDGSVMRVLEDRCPTTAYALCEQLPRLQAYRERLASQPPATDPREGMPLADHFLWGGVLSEVNLERADADARELIPATLLEHPWSQLQATLRAIARQSVRIAVGDGLWAYHAEEEPSPTIRRVFGEEAYARYRASDQIQGRLDPWLPTVLQLVVLGASVVVVTVVWLRRGGGPGGFALLFVLLMIAANAAISGALAPLHDRYQGRVVWLLPMMAVFLAAAALRAERRPSAAAPEPFAPGPPAAPPLPAARLAGRDHPRPEP